MLRIQQRTQSNPDDKFHLRIRANNTGRFIWEAARAPNGNQNEAANIRITYTRKKLSAKVQIRTSSYLELNDENIIINIETASFLSFRIFVPSFGLTTKRCALPRSS